MNTKDGVNVELREQMIYEKVELIVDSFINSSKLTKMEFLKKVFDSAFELIPEAEKGSYFELVGNHYVPLFSRGYDIEVLKKLKFRKEESFNDYKCSDISSIEAYEICVEKRIDDNFDSETIDVFKTLGTYEDFKSIYAPIQVDNFNIGIICLDNFTDSNYSDISKKILKFYAQMISNFYSMIISKEREAQTNNEVVMALVSAIEVNDAYTEGHGKRVREYSIKIAEKMNLSELEIHDIGTAALLHDVGKIGIPSEILNKPGKLSDSEYGIIKQHPAYTKKILEKISRFSNIVEYAYCHHEYYNGRGYPQGLKGDEIPLGSQIIILADVFDAMTSDRSYRKALSVDEAIAIIKKGEGKLYNPEIAEIAIKVFLEIEK